MINSPGHVVVTFVQETTSKNPNPGQAKTDSVMTAPLKICPT